MSSVASTGNQGNVGFKDTYQNSGTSKQQPGSDTLVMVLTQNEMNLINNNFDLFYQGVHYKGLSFTSTGNLNGGLEGYYETVTKNGNVFDFSKLQNTEFGGLLINVQTKGIEKIDFVLNDPAAIIAYANTHLNGEVTCFDLPSNLPPSDPDETFTITEDQAFDGTYNNVAHSILLGNKLTGATDPNGNIIDMFSLDAVSFDATGVSPLLTTKLPGLTVSITDSSFVGDNEVKLTIHTTAGDAVETIKLDGTATLSDPNHIFNAMDYNDVLKIFLDYKVTDNMGGFDTSKETIVINGANDAPTAQDDHATTDEDHSGTIALGNKIDGIPDSAGHDTDPDGDTITLASVSAPTIVTESGTSPTITISAFDPTAPYDYTFTSSSGTSHLTITAAGDVTLTTATGSGAFDIMNPGDNIEIQIPYTISDGNGGTDTATASICIAGTADFVPDTDECIFPWSLFAFQPGVDTTDTSQVALATIDDDHIERLFLKFQIDTGDGSGVHQITYQGHDVLFHTYSNTSGLVDYNNDYHLTSSNPNETLNVTDPLILDVLIVQQLSSSSPLYGVNEIHDLPTGNPYFTFSSGGQNQAGALFLTGTGGNDASLNGNNNGDVVLGLAGDDSTQGNNCEDYLNGGTGNDLLGGNADDDILFGGDGNDGSTTTPLSGDNGNDVILGGAGNDIMDGGADEDVLYGGTGNDIMMDQSGTDLFVFAIGTSGSNLTLPSENDLVKGFGTSGGNQDLVGFLDVSTAKVLASLDTNNDFILQATEMGNHDATATQAEVNALFPGMTIATGDFSGNSQTDTKLTFADGHTIIFESYNNANVLTDLINQGHLQVIAAPFA